MLARHDITSQDRNMPRVHGGMSAKTHLTVHQHSPRQLMQPVHMQLVPPDRDDRSLCLPSEPSLK